MTKYYLGQNKMEYLTPADAEMHGGGLVGVRETVTEVKAVTYTDLTGNKPPESPVDHVIVHVDPVPPKVMEEIRKEEAVTQPTMPVETYVPPVEIKIVATEPVKPVETNDLNSKTDDELRAMCKARKFVGTFKMKRETMLRKLSA